MTNLAKYFIVFSFGALASFGVSVKDIKRDLARCAALKGSLERLGCFDKLTKSHALRPNQPIVTGAIGSVGGWRVSQKTNPIDDSKTVTILLRAKTGKSRFGKPVFLVARCKSNKTEVYINWHDYLGDDGNSVYTNYKHVTLRVGSSPSQRQKWAISTDKKATFAPQWPGNLLKSMLSQNEFVAQVTPYNESPTTAIFDVRGLQKALRPLAQTCGWSF